MVQGKFTCSCYNPKFREVITVKGTGFNDIWEKAKRKAAKKYKIKASEVDITSSYYYEIMFEARKRTALDGKEWWCVYNTKENKWSTFLYHGKYKTKKDCEYAIEKYMKEAAL